MDKTTIYSLGAFIILVIGLIAWGLLSDSQSAPVVVRTETTERLAGLVASFPEVSKEHTTSIDNEDSYNSNPPTSGPHFAQAPTWGVYDAPIADESALHALEHGGIWISYTNISDEQLSDIESIQRSNRGSVIVSPRSENTSPVVVTAWTKMLELDHVDSELIQAFINAYKNQTHEPLAR